MPGEVLMNFGVTQGSGTLKTATKRVNPFRYKHTASA